MFLRILRKKPLIKENEIVIYFISFEFMYMMWVILCKKQIYDEKYTPSENAKKNMYSNDCMY
jgi:hypothetical protein